MKKLLFISALVFSSGARAQINWSQYSTTLENRKDTPSLGVAIPYHGNYDNFDRGKVGISHWNPGYGMGIDTTLDPEIPLFQVYDTTGVYFLFPNLNRKNAGNFAFAVLLNNKTFVTPWSPVTRFTEKAVGNMEAGSGISGSYRAALGQYLVAHLRDKSGVILSTKVIYFKRNAPEIRLISTSDNPEAFTGLVTNENHFQNGPLPVGWHRQYTHQLAGESAPLTLAPDEKYVLIEIDAQIYQKAAMEYALFDGDREIRKWAANEYDNRYILLKRLAPGDYRLLVRFSRQPGSVRELRFALAPAWYQTAAFYTALVAFLLLAVACWLLVSKYRKQRRGLAIANKNAEQSAEALQNIHSLLNPHFTFNALSSIQGLVNKGDVDAAGKYLSSFGALLRETLRESKTRHIPLHKELENLNLYVSLEQLRYTFTYQLSVDEHIPLYATEIPPFLLQPFVENAIKHGISRKNGQGTLKIDILKSGSGMQVKIADNGPGFEAGDLKEGYGLSLSKKRIALQNHEYGEELIGLKMESSQEGTLITLSFKNWL